MKTSAKVSRMGSAGFTMVEVMVSMTIVVLTLGLAMSAFLFSMKAMYKDSQRLASNSSLRKFMSQIANETLNSSYYYLFPYYTSLDGTVDLAADPVSPTQAYNNANDLYDQWIAHGDCLVLVTLTSQYRTTDIRQIRIYYRVTRDQNTTAGANLNGEAPLRYYETADTGGIPGNGWGEGTSSTGNGHPASGLATELNGINLNSNPSLSGSKLINARSLGRFKTSPATDRWPIFSTLSSVAGPTTGSISINVEFVNGTTSMNMLSSSSFNYTVSPRK